MTDYKDGDEITVNGKPFRIEGGALVPVVKRVPLGGELKMLADCRVGDFVCLLGRIQNGLPLPGSEKAVKFYGVNGYVGIPMNAICETNIPPRPTFTPMTAGEAARLPDIVGRWVAVQVRQTDKYEIVLGDEKYERWFDSDDKIMLIEGVDL